MTVIDVKQVSQVFGKEPNSIQVLKEINMQIAEGEFVVVQGRSGSGKSTLLNILGGFLKPTAGSVRVNDLDITTYNENQLSAYRRNHVGFIFQQFHLFGNMSALKNVEEPLFYAGVRAKERKERAREMLEEVGLGDRIHHMTHQLSGGQQQRVAIARALVTRPSLILADEPTGNLDTSTEQEIIELLHKVNKDFNKTLIVVTHSDLVAKAADRKLAISDGSLLGNEGDYNESRKGFQPIG